MKYFKTHTQFLNEMRRSKEPFTFSEKEVKDIADLIAKAIAKVDKTKAAVHDMEFVDGEGAGFEISIDGEKYDGGSYDVRPNGEVVNVAIGNSFPNAIYAKIGDKNINQIIKNIKKFESAVTEAKLSKIHNAAKKGSYPVTLVVIENGKVVKQELVGTPQIVPAAFNQLKKEYPKATVHVESKTGKRLFSESVVTEGKLKISGAAYDLWDEKEVQRKLRGVKIKIVGDIGGVATIKGDDKELQKVKDILGLNEAFEEIGDLVKALHFEMDPKRAEEMKIELGKRQGEVVLRKQIEGGNYSLRRFRKEIKYDDKGTDLGVFRPGSYMAATSKLGDGPHKKKVKAKRWNQRMYDQWIEDVASNDGWKHAYDMAQNAKHEPGLLQWVKKMFRGENPMQRIQWDIEAHAE